MKRFLIPFIALSLCAPANADLGAADITGPSGQTTTGKSYKARCGTSKKKCVVSFRGEKFIVNDSDGIYRDQFVDVNLQKACKQRALLLPWVTSCFANQLDWDFTLTYLNEAGERRSALVSFIPRYLSTGATDRAQDFQRDLQVWLQGILRPVGPSIKVEQPREPIQTRPVPPRQKEELSCKPALRGFECDWQKYLDANPSVKAWADANPELAEKERIRAGGK